MSTIANSGRRPNYLLLVLFIVAVVGVGAFIGINTAPGEWYAALAKPPFNPPNWLFGPVWFVLYVLIAIAGWRVATRAHDSGAMKVWFAQMILNWAWSPVWFGLHQIWPAFVIISAILLLILGFIALSWRSGDRVSAALFLPYAAWVAFASALNLGIALLN